LPNLPLAGKKIPVGRHPLEERRIDVPVATEVWHEQDVDVQGAIRATEAGSAQPGFDDLRAAVARVQEALARVLEQDDQLARLETDSSSQGASSSIGADIAFTARGVVAATSRHSLGTCGIEPKPSIAQRRHVFGLGLLGPHIV
jgi:hypothetical protein